MHTKISMMNEVAHFEVKEGLRLDWHEPKRER